MLCLLQRLRGQSGLLHHSLAKWLVSFRDMRCVHRLDGAFFWARLLGLGESSRLRLSEVASEWHVLLEDLTIFNVTNLINMAERFANRHGL